MDSRTITSERISQETSGYIVSFNHLAKTRTFTPNHEKNAPIILGSADNISDGPDITSAGIFISKPGESDIAIPELYKDFLLVACNSVEDFIHTYGWNTFKASAFQLTIQRTTIMPNKPHRDTFSEFHTHGGNIRNPYITFYSFADRLGTVFRNGANIKAAPDGSLSRFGPREDHKSPTNTTAQPIRRTWGSVTVRKYDQTQDGTTNRLLDASGKARKDFKARAIELLQHQRATTTSNIERQPVFLSNE